MNVSSDRHLLALVYLSESERSRGSTLASPVGGLLERLGIDRVQLVVERDSGADDDDEREAIEEAEPATHDRDALGDLFADATVTSVTALTRSGIQVAASGRFPAGAVPEERVPRTI